MHTILTVFKAIHAKNSKIINIENFSNKKFHEEATFFIYPEFKDTIPESAKSLRDHYSLISGKNMMKEIRNWGQSEAYQLMKSLDLDDKKYTFEDNASKTMMETLKKSKRLEMIDSMKTSFCTHNYGVGLNRPFPREIEEILFLLALSDVVRFLCNTMADHVCNYLDFKEDDLKKWEDSSFVNNLYNDFTDTGIKEDNFVFSYIIWFIDKYEVLKV